jgi:hypothetical protein
MAKKEEPSLSLASPEAATSAAESAWIHWKDTRADAGIEYITGVKAGVTYEVRARYINVLGVHGPWTYSTCQVEGPSGPEAPTGLTFSTSPAAMSTVPPLWSGYERTKYAAALILWNESTSSDVLHYELGSLGTSGNVIPFKRVPVGTTSAPIYGGAEYNPTVDEITVRAVSRSGLASAWATPMIMAFPTFAYGPPD